MADVDLKPLPPEEAIAYLQGKGFRFSWRWQEMWHEDHVKAFTVAKAMRIDILKEIREALEKSLQEGTTFETFRKNMEPLLQAKGWWGKKTVDGETVQLGSPRRLSTIFNTNVQTAFSVGHYRSMNEPEVLAARPFWRYVALNDGRTRPQHLAWHNTVLPADHPWWETHYPPCAWNCRCTVVNHSQRELDRDGYKITEDPDDSVEMKRNPRTGQMEPYPAGIDPGWDYNPGEASVLWDRARTGRDMQVIAGQKTWKDFGRPDLRALSPEDRLAAPALLATGRDAKEAAEILAEAFGLSGDKRFIDVDTADGDKAIIHRELLPHIVEKRQETRERYGYYLLETLKKPYEIWLTDFEDGLRKQYIGVFTGKTDLATTVRLNRDGSVVWNVMQANDKKMNSHRVGTLIHEK